MAARPSRIDEVRHGLLADLVNGTTPVGTKLPNEQEIASRFGVSRATVREAVGGLVESGYLLRRHGSGTFVTLLPSRRHALDATLSYTQMIRQAGMTPGLRLLSADGAPGRGRTRRPTWRSTRARPLRVLERLRTADERPVVYSIDLIAARRLEGLRDEDLDTGLYDVLDSVGLPGPHGLGGAAAGRRRRPPGPAARRTPWHRAAADRRGRPHRRRQPGHAVDRVARAGHLRAPGQPALLSRLLSRPARIT